MAEVVKGIVDIEINTGNAARELKALQQQINAFNLAINKGNTFQTAAAAKYSSELKDVINASRFFTAETVKMQTAAGALDSTLKKGQSTLGSFFSAKFSRNSALFAETMGLAAERARTMQTQFIATSGSAKGMQDALAIRPLAAFNSEMAIAAQRSQILSTMFRQGTTQLINFGKNVQWAGRQLMVGFTLPLASFGIMAGKTFKDLEKQTVAFKKVYGDIFTTPTELQGNLDAIMGLAKEYTKYGIAVKDTVGLGAQAAAAGRRNKDLTDAVSEATRLATLGQMDQNEALKTTIALQSAFRLSGQDLSNAINFLNIVENQTVVSLQDLAAAIPKVAPVIVGLGGDVKDLSVFLAAMQEGGVSAEQGANALKSGLASLINPSKAAKETLGQLGINMDYIVNQNRGDLMGTVTAFSRALGTLDDFSRQQALEKIFGKYQYARLGALFDNLTRQGSQAQQVMDAAGFSVEQMAASADKELNTIEQSFGVQLTAAIEKFKLSLAPLGEMFLRMAIPVVNFFTKIMEGFNNLPDFTKKFAALATIITGLVIPAGTMFFGLLMNLSGTLAKLMQGIGIFTKGTLKGGVLGGIQAVSQSMKYMSLQELDSALAAKQLGTATMSVNQALLAQVSSAQGARQAITGLADTYGLLITRMAEAAAISKFTLGTPGAAMQIAQTRNIKGGFPTKKFATGGVVPGSGNKDTVPAMLTPGEFVVNKEATNSVGANFLKMLNGGKVGGYNNGGFLNDYKKMAAEKTAQRISSGRGLRAALNNPNSTVSMSARVPIGQPIIIKSNKKQNEEVLQSREKNNFVYRLSASDNQLLKSSGVSGDKLLSRMLTPKSLSSITHMAPQQNWDIFGYRSAIVTRHKQIKALFPKKEIRYVDSLSNADTRTAMRDPRNANVQFIPLSSLHNKRVLSTLSSQHRAKLFGKGAKYKSGYRKPLSGQQRDNNTPFLKKDFKEGEELPTSGIIKPYQSKNLPSEMTKDRELRIGDHALYQDSGRTMRWNGSDWEDVTGKVKGVYLKESAKNRGAYAKLPSEGKYQYAHVENIRTFSKGGSVPSLLTPGEFVVNKDAAAANRPFLDALNQGKVKRFGLGTPGEDGRTPAGVYDQNAGPLTRQQSRVGVVSSGASRIGTAAGIASFPAMIAGPALQASSNELAKKMGSLVSSVTPVLFGMQLLGPVTKGLVKKFPALLGAGGGVVVAMAALGIATYKVIEQINKVRQSGAELTKAMYGSSDTVNQMAKAFGRQSATQSLTSSRAQAAGGAVSAQAQASADQFMQTDIAKEMLADIERVKAAGGDAALAVRNQLTRSIMAGVITPEEARGVAISLGNALNDQKLAIDVSAQLKSLIGTNGELIQNNQMKIYAEIIPKFNQTEIQNTAEDLYAQQTGGFMGTVGSFFDNKELEIQKIAVNDIAERTATAATMQREAVDSVTKSYEAGTMKVDEYNKKINELSTVSSAAANSGLSAIADQLGVTVKELDNIKKQKFATGTKNSTRYVPTERAQQILAATKEMEKAAQDSLTNAAVDKKVSDQIIKGLQDEDIELQFEILGAIAGGAVSEEVNAKIKELTGVDVGGAFKSKGPAAGGPSAVIATTGTGEEYPPTVDNQKSKIELLKESITQTKEYGKALDYLIKAGLSAEAVATLDAATAIEIMNGKRKDLIKSINDQSVAQRVLQSVLKSKDEQSIDILNVEIDAINSSIDAENRKMDVINRANELDQRRISVRQHGLDVLSKKEAAVNKVYDDRVNALNKVKEANNAVAQQQQDRISLASALTSGDFAGAAQAASTMTANFASEQLTNVQSELEAQKQREIESLTVSINGQLMGRKQIEDSINIINEEIYQRNLNSIPIQDAIFAGEERKKIINDEINTINRQIFAEQIKQEGQLASQSKYLKNMVEYYKKIAYWTNQAANKTYVEANTGGQIVKKAFGGAMKKYAFGGMASGSKESPPPLKMAFGSMVPGMGNTDKVSALLTPGEFVVRKSVAEANMPLLKSLNSNVFGAGMSVGSPNISPVDATTSVSNVSAPVYNYNVNVNVTDTDASPNEIADVVMNKIRMTKDRSVRGNRY